MRIFQENLIQDLKSYLRVSEITNQAEIMDQLVKFKVRVNEMEPIDLEGTTKDLKIK